MSERRKTDKLGTQRERGGYETAEEIYRKEIRPHEGGVIGPSPSGNVHDSHIPPARRA